MCFAHDVSEHGLQQFHRSPPSPDRVGPVASCARTPGTRDTHTEGHQQGLCRATLAATHQERTLGPRHTHGSYGRSRRQGGRKHPQNPTGSPGPWFGTHTGCGSAVAGVSGAVQEKWDHQHLEVGSGSGDSLDFPGSMRCSPCFPRAPQRVRCSHQSQRMCQHHGDLCRGAASSQQPQTSTKDPPQPLLPICAPGADPKAPGEGASFSSHAGPITPSDGL